MNNAKKLLTTEASGILKTALEHGQCVGDMAYLLAKTMDLNERQAIFLKLAGLYHDIGKCRIEPEIVNKAGPLTDQEYSVIKTHVVHSYKMLKKKGLDQEICKAVLAHHEDFSGGGYPFGSERQNIILGGRILRICDFYAALTSDRVYRKALPGQEAIEEMSSEVHCHKFDPDIFEIFKYMIFKENSSMNDFRRGLNEKIT